MKKALIQTLHILLEKQGATEHKQSMYAQYGVTSSKELTEAQLRELIVGLGRDAVTDTESAIKTLRSAILKVMTAPAIGSERQRGLEIPNNWSYMNPFILKWGGKRLPDMTIEELKVFKRKLYAMRKSGWSYQQQVLTPASPSPPTINVVIPLHGSSVVS